MFEGHLQMLKDGDLHYLVEGRKTNQMQMYEVAIECIRESISKSDVKKDIIKAIRNAEYDGECIFRLKDGMETAVDIIKEFQTSK